MFSIFPLPSDIYPNLEEQNKSMNILVEAIGTNDSCPICNEEFTEQQLRDQTIHQTACYHLFHNDSECLPKWVNKNASEQKRIECPVCSAKIGDWNKETETSKKIMGLVQSEVLKQLDRKKKVALDEQKAKELQKELDEEERRRTLEDEEVAKKLFEEFASEESNLEKRKEIQQKIDEKIAEKLSEELATEGVNLEKQKKIQQKIDEEIAKKLERELDTSNRNGPKKSQQAEDQENIEPKKREVPGMDYPPFHPAINRLAPQAAHRHIIVDDKDDTTGCCTLQ